MTPTWQGETEPPPFEPTIGDWLRIIARGLPLAIVTFGCLALLLLIRLIERPIFGLKRPVTPYITQFVCRSAFIIMGMQHRVQGEIMQQRGAIVANHGSWLDIFALNAPKRIYFVAKAEVAGWIGIGWLARATGTVFIRRERQDAARQKLIFAARLRAGHKLLFFPEGTSSDGQRVLQFKPTLFAAFFDDGLREAMHIQPVTVNYTAPDGARADFYGWWGDMGFAPHLLKTLAAKRPGAVEIIYHAPVAVAAFDDRKALARAMEDAVRGGLAQISSQEV
ncbi:1-acyl-sn-glycerol-3-phosphate acyltransferase [Cognatishimia sp. MH4019]|uniref:lysophospholipid acyltransferase family protein n=1 Tax=Cognatishimia sp. MH4019 TaxID=2854030 RepID=UPI001CD22888|nr:lysophospholipid acyltransferase family protein [Cognatishimia sp. MH4019]